MLENNLKIIQKNINEACLNSQRNINNITLLAVSKTKTVEEIMTAYNLGIRSFGENKVQELLYKYDELPKDTRWHMIGHLQRNKVKYIAPFITCIHSVDSLRLAETINNEAKKNNRIIDILVEVNIAHEESKFGFKVEEVIPFLESIQGYQNIKVTGLMTVAPNPINKEENRPYFKEIYKLFIDIHKEKRDNVNMNVLSMGMSKDYMIAIEEGATIIRVGSDLFGSRL